MGINADLAELAQADLVHSRGFFIGLPTYEMTADQVAGLCEKLRPVGAGSRGKSLS